MKHPDLPEAGAEASASMSGAAPAAHLHPGPGSLKAPAEPVRDWRAFFNTRMLTCVFLGFSSGLPLFVLITLMQGWMRDAGVDIRVIGMFALVQLPYAWKFVWSPLMDRFVPGLPGWRPGRRRGWMLLTQVLVALAIGSLGFFSPKHDLTVIAALAIGLAFFSASQDIVIDAYRRELLGDAEQGLGTAIYVNAYKVAGLVPGGLSLILSAYLSWPAVFVVTAAFMVPGMLTSLVIGEPRTPGAPPKSLKEAVILPFREFLARDGWRGAVLVLAFIFLYKLGDSMATSLATEFYRDLGFTLPQIGVIAKTTSFWASIAGGLVGGACLIRIGIGRGLWIFGIVQWLSILGFMWLAIHGRSTLGLGCVVAFEAFSAGLGTAAFTAYMASATDARYTATQFALFTSLSAVPRTVANASAGYLEKMIGWSEFFLICSLLAIPGILILTRVAPWSRHR